MRFTLSESSHRRQRSVGATLVSSAAHAFVIGGTIVATGMTAERPAPRVRRDETLVYVKAQQPPATPNTASRHARLLPLPRLDDRPPDLVALTVVVPSAVVPFVLPETNERLGGLFDRDAAVPSAAATSASSGSRLSLDMGSAMSATAVDREVVPISGATPRYPRSLANAGVEGIVIAQFVVDTLGRVERETIRMERADHAQFEQSVREALTRMRFTPAESQGRKVRQLVAQPFTFALSGR